MYKTVIETDSFVVDYDIARNRIRVSYFDGNHFQDEISFYEKCVSCKYLTKAGGCSHPHALSCDDECLWWPDYDVPKDDKC